MAKPSAAKKQYNFMMCDVLKERKKHMLASLHYNKRGNITFIISAVITLVQAFLASLAQAEADSLKKHTSSFSLTIAFLAAISVFWQSLLKNWNYKGKATLHDSAAAALGKIYKTTSLKSKELKAEEDDKDVDEDADETSNMLKSLVAQFEQATDSCTSLVPAKITAAFELLDNKIEICKRKVYTDQGNTTDEEKDSPETKVEWDSVYTSLYRELSAAIIRRKKWPFFIPDPESVVKETMEKYQMVETEKTPSLLQTVLKRNIKINEQYSEFSPTTSVDGDNTPPLA